MEQCGSAGDIQDNCLMNLSSREIRGMARPRSEPILHPPVVRYLNYEKGKIMKRQILAAVVMLFAGGSVLAQSVVVEPEQRTRIKEYVVKQKVPRVVVRERLSVGATVPADVELREVPEDWGPSVRKYRYYHTDTGVHFVDPESRRVIYDID
jgi:hypothetical protein